MYKERLKQLDCSDAPKLKAGGKKHTKGNIYVFFLPPGTRRQLAKDKREEEEKAQGNCPVGFLTHVVE